MSPNAKPRLVLLVSVLLFILCLTQDGICIAGECSRYSPVAMLAMGVMQFVVGNFSAGVAWFANPMLLLAWILLLCMLYQSAFGCSIGALAMALSLLFTRRVMASESGFAEQITDFAPGYWLWVWSMATAALGAGWAAWPIIKKDWRPA
jgi:hypothetical protein